MIYTMIKISDFSKLFEPIVFIDTKIISIRKNK